MGEKPNTSSHSPVISDSRSLLASFIGCARIGRLEIIAPPALSPHLPTETLAGMARPRALHYLPLLSASSAPARFLSGRRYDAANFYRYPPHSIAMCYRSSYLPR